MPHATSASDAQDVQDDLLIQQVLDPENTTFDVSRDLEPGEKADDAVDYGDLSDDDLADDEETSRSIHPKTQQNDLSYETLDSLPYEDNNQTTDVNGELQDDFDDLFEGIAQPPTDKAQPVEDESDSSQQAYLGSFESQQVADTQNEYHQRPLFQSSVDWRTANGDQPRPLRALDAQPMSEDEKMQQYLISMSTQGVGTQHSRLNLVDTQAHARDLSSLWPKFEPDSVPRFMDLLPLKRSSYIGKKPLKQPRPVHPTKLSLELALDQEKNFRLSAGPGRKFDDEERQAIIKIMPPNMSEEDSAEDAPMLSESEGEPIGDVTWQDLQIVCEDWDSWNLPDSPGLRSSASIDEIDQRARSDRDHSGTENDEYPDLTFAKVSREPWLKYRLLRNL